MLTIDCRCLRLAAMCLATLFLTPAVFAQTLYDFNLPSQALADSLRAIGQQASVNILFDPQSVDKLMAPAVHGQFSVSQAVNRVLAGTNLSAEQTEANTLLVGPKDKSGKAGIGRTALAPTTSAVNDLPNSIGGLAQVDQGQNSSDISVGKQKDRNSQQTSTALSEIVVTSQYQFLSADTSGTTGLPIPIEKVPQSISLVSNDFIEAADLKTLGEIAEYTPGAINVGNQENYGSIIDLRGFTAGRAIDGINLESPSFYEPDYAIFDRLEIVKGPSSVVYGVSSPGGLVNFVTKSATPQTTDYLSVQAGSWNSYRVEGQLAGPLDSAGHIRAIGVAVYDQGDSFMDEMNHKKVSLYGGINVDFSDSVTGYIHGGYERFVRTSFDGTPTEPDGSPAALPRSFFIGSPALQVTTSVYHTEGDLTWHATDMLEFSVKGNYETAKSVGIAGYSYGLQTDGDISLDLEKLVPYLNENYGVGASSIFHFDTLGLKNSFVSIGALYQYDANTSDVLFPNAPGTSNIFLGQAAINQAFDSLLSGTFSPYDVDGTTKVLTFSAQSVLQLIDPVSLLLGVSYSKPDETVVTDFSPPQDFNFRGQVSYRAGLTYEFLPRTNAYLSYSQSFNPQSALEVGNIPVPPITGEQYEAGVKYRSAGGRLLLTGALFQINEKNVAQYSTTIDGFDYDEPVGEVRHRGVELQALGQITREWQINAGYAYLDPEITDATASLAAPMTATIGQTQLYLPKQTASVYSTYTLNEGTLRGLSFGGGIRYVSSERTSYDSAEANVQSGLSPTKNLPGYALVDANVGYTTGDWHVQLNARNIFNKFYLINNYQTLFYGNQVGAPANVALTVRRSF